MRRLFLPVLFLLSLFVSFSIRADDKMILMPSPLAVFGLADELEFALSGRNITVVNESDYEDTAGCALAAHLDGTFGVWLESTNNKPTIFVCDVSTMTVHHAPLPSNPSCSTQAESAALVVVSLISDDFSTSKTPSRNYSLSASDHSTALDTEVPWQKHQQLTHRSLKRLSPAIAFVALGLTISFSIAAVIISTLDSQRPSTTISTLDASGSSITNDTKTAKSNTRPFHPALFYSAVGATVAFGTATAVVSIWFTDWTFGRPMKPEVSGRQNTLSFRFNYRF